MECSPLVETVWKLQFWGFSFSVRARAGLAQLCTRSTGVVSLTPPLYPLPTHTHTIEHWEQIIRTPTHTQRRAAKSVHAQAHAAPRGAMWNAHAAPRGAVWIAHGAVWIHTQRHAMLCLVFIISCAPCEFYTPRHTPRRAAPCGLHTAPCGFTRSAVWTPRGGACDFFFPWGPISSAACTPAWGGRFPRKPYKTCVNWGFWSRWAGRSPPPRGEIHENLIDASFTDLKWPVYSPIWYPKVVLSVN